MNEYELVRYNDYVGFANIYLKKSKSDDKIDINIYSELVQLDSKLGTTATEQLEACVYHSLRLDLIKV